MGDVIMFVPRPNPDRFAKAHEQVRFELSSLVMFAKSGGPIIDCHDDYACSEINPQDCA